MDAWLWKGKQPALLSWEGTLSTLGSYWRDGRRSQFQLPLNHTLPGPLKPKYRKDRRNMGS